MLKPGSGIVRAALLKPRSGEVRGAVLKPRTGGVRASVLKPSGRRSGGQRCSSHAAANDGLPC